MVFTCKKRKKKSKIRKKENFFSKSARNTKKKKKMSLESNGNYNCENLECTEKTICLMI